jgi:adenosylcobinamide-phosphate synthase
MFGKLISSADKWFNQRRYRGRQRRLLGTMAFFALIALSATIGVGIGFFGPFAELICLAILLAGRSLDQHILAVAKALGDNINAARKAISMIVGRRTNDMDEAEISRAAIETGAENLSDGVFAPALWFLIGGIPGLLIYKMSNTADSMIGYRNPRYFAFGWAAARFDDLLNYVPARLTSLFIVFASMNAKGGVLLSIKTILRDSNSHASPNAGWPESAMAGSLNLWLGGPRHYGNRLRKAAKLNGDGDDAIGANINHALVIMRTALWLFGLALLIFGAPALARGMVAGWQMIAG